MSRLSYGGLIDRKAPLNFVFDGKPLRGFAGDTLASALLANDVRLVGRSFKYHRPRGVMTAGPEEPNALVTLRKAARAEPNTKATTVELYDGLEAASQNRWPNLRFDAMAINQLAAPLFVAGFYYKTFMWPAAFWEKVYEPLIRRAAGLGALSGAPDPDRYDRDHAFCDLLVIGAGPAGLAAALAAASGGLRVLVVEQDARCGGRLLAERQEIDGEPGVLWADAATRELAGTPNVRLLTRTSLVGVYDGEYVALEHVSDDVAVPPPGQPRQRLWKIVARRAILSTGALERPIVFGGNDRPGVMLASAVSTYLNRFAAAPGARAVVFTCSDSGWATALDLHRAGERLIAVVDSRGCAPPAAERLRAQGVAIHLDSVVTEARGAPLHTVKVRAANGQETRLRADLLAVAGGWDPAIGLASHLGGRATWSETLQTFVQTAPPVGMTIAGAAAGVWSLDAVLAHGADAGRQAASDLGRPGPPARRLQTEPEPCEVVPVWSVPQARTKAFVDFQHDVTNSDITLAALEGFVSVEHLKRYTTLGMATDQGKTSQLNGHALLAAATQATIGEVGAIRARPPYVPVAIGALAGHHRDQHFRPVRRTASHDWAQAHNANFVDAGAWKRAQWYARPEDADWLATVNREVTATRSGVGVCDVSTLGKIDVQGPDAGVLLDRLYINTVSTLAVGRARYGVMLREDGLVMDDGAVTRFAEDRFFVTTTTVNAAKVMQHIDFARQVLWPQLDVQATSVTEQWATFAIAGPQSRALVRRALPNLDLSNDAFPFMAAAEITWRGRPARLYRLSFSGELAYELSVPARYGDELVRALFQAGGALGVTPYGVEALGVMRIEKGHPAGAELNGQTTVGDLGLERMMSRKKDFIGRVMAARPGLVDPDRPTLVGLKPCRPDDRLRAGAHLLSRGAKPTARNDQGHVTSAAFSPTLGTPIALALLTRGRERHGEVIVMHDPVRGPDVEAEVCAPVFFDPEGSRLRD